MQINKGPGVTIVSQGNNLCSDATLTPTAASDLINTNPLLAILGNYGGTTQTIALTQSPCTNLTPTARALIGNATVVNTTGLGYLTFWPGDAVQPLVATSNFTAGQVINWYFTVGLAADGSYKRFASQTDDLVVDISGFFAP